ncbi:MAG TPA: DUF554 domain-containing protein [Verrucomicrobiae bacterium]|nr:DUF554 domain-containing protein [Verrucomicrobiae bacterium]
MKGTLVNTATVLIGAAIGYFAGARLPERIRTILMQGLGLVTLVLGVRMILAAEGSNAVIKVAGALLLGGIAGELLKIEQGLEKVGDYLKNKMQSESATFVLGFVSASLLFCVGPMTIVGSIEDGVRGDASILYTKSIMDGVAAVALASSLGVGVFFSALTVLIIQGGLTLLGAQLSVLSGSAVINNLTSTGGAMILGISFKLLNIAAVRVGNFLPALVLVVLFSLWF